MIRSCRKTLGTARGYLIVEVMAALLLCSIALGSLVPLLVGTIRGGDLGRRASAAGSIGQDKIEQLRNTAYAAVVGGNDSVTQSDTGTIFTRTWAVAAGPTGSTKKVTVTVAWTDRTTRQIQLQTIVGQ
jgi:type II secretory pathway pseudopilin PulG